MKTNKETHARYKVKISSLDGDFSEILNLLEQQMICGSVTSLQIGPWLEELEQEDIHLSDIGKKGSENRSAHWC